MKTNLTNAVISANTAYSTRKGANAVLNAKGIQADLSVALDIIAGLTDGQISAISALEITPKIIAGLHDATNTKKPMRTLQGLLFALTGDGKFLKGSARTFILEFCGLVVGGAKTRAGLAFCATGKGDESTSDEVKIIKARQIMKVFGVVSASSEQTQNSVAFSRGGIAETLGVARKDTRTGMPVINLENRVALALDAIVRNMTDSKLALIVAQSGAKTKA